MRQKNKIPSKASKPKYAIVVDGECEAWYIQMLKRNEKLTDINLEPKIPQKKKLSELYKQVTELAKDYDKVFWIVDMDVILKENREAKPGEKKALQKFQEYCQSIDEINNQYNQEQGFDPEKDSEKMDLIKVIVNNPCLEYWFLLHFEKITKYYDCCDSLLKQLHKHPEIKDYKKTEKYFKQGNDIYLRLKPFLKTAVANAKQTGEFDFNKAECGVSEMHKLFEAEGLKDLIK